MPRAALGLKKYLDGTAWVSRIADKEHALPSLGNVEVLSVQAAVGPPKPEFSQRPEDDAHVPAFVNRTQARNVLQEKPTGSESTSDSDDLGEESAAWVSHATTLSSHGVPLAGPAPHDKVNWLEFSNVHLPHVTVPPDARPVMRQHAVAVGIVLDLEPDLKSSPFKCQINAPNPGEE